MGYAFPSKNRPGDFVRQLTIAAASTLVLAATVACNSPPKNTGPAKKNVDEPRKIVVTPDFWKTSVKSDKNSFVITESTSIKDTKENAAITLSDQCCRRAIELTIKDLLRDADLYSKNENEIERLFLEQFRKYLAGSKVLKSETFGDGKKIGVQIEVEVARDKLQKALAEEGFIQNQSLRVILIVRKAAAGASGETTEAQAYLGDIADSLSQDMVERGFQPKLWKAVKRSMSEKRDAKDKAFEKFLTTFIEDSDWQKPEDEDYELPVVLLRAEGRMLIGFRFLQLEKVGMTYRGLIRGDVYDLLNDRSLGFKTAKAQETIGSRSLVEVRQALVEKCAKDLIEPLTALLQSTLDREKRLRSYEYTFVFKGYKQDEIERIESLMAGVISEDVDSSQDGDLLTIDCEVARAPIPVRDEIKRCLSRMGLKPKSARKKGTTFTFTKG
jgi:hypothetical protein